MEYDVNCHILLLGLPRPLESLMLAPGLTLKPLNEISIFDLAAAGGAGFIPWAVLGPMAHACTCEIESANDATAYPGYDTLNRAWLASTLLVLRGFTAHICVATSSYSWNTVAGKHLRVDTLPPFQGNLLDCHLTFLINSKTRRDSVKPDDAQWISDHFDVFNRLASESPKFKFALEAATEWRFLKDPRNAVARLWSGIEAIFSVSSELVYRISVLSASLLTDRGNQRKEKFNQIKKLYGARSKIVHGDAIDDEKVVEALNQSYELLSDLLIVSISRGHVLTDADFDQALFF
jgi:hypothetical protein